jgi:hypothetical protein
MNVRSSAVLLAVCLSATAVFAAPPAQREVSATKITVAVDANGNFRQTTVQEQLVLATTPRPSIMRMPVAAQSSRSNVVALDETHDHLLVARTDADGNIVIVCTDDHSVAADVTSSTVDTVLRLKTRELAKRMKAERE